MKVAPTLNGGLRIDAEDAADWEILRCIVLDARWGSVDLADRLGDLVKEELEPGDWQEYVVPELRTEFGGQLATIESAIESAAQASGGQAGSLLIRREDAEAWYGGLNQARLAIEEEHRFGAHMGRAPDAAEPVRRSAFFRSQFYMAVQGMLLEGIMPLP